VFSERLIFAQRGVDRRRLNFVRRRIIVLIA